MRNSLGQEATLRAFGSIRNTIGGITESGLYKLIMRSSRPEARKFQDWVTRVVLPSIRKDGGYVAGEEKVATGEMTDDELVLRTMTMLQAKVARLTSECAVMSPKAAVFDEHVAPRDGDTIVRLARTLDGVNINAVARDLMTEGWLYRTRGKAPKDVTQEIRRLLISRLVVI